MCVRIVCLFSDKNWKSIIISVEIYKNTKVTTNQTKSEYDTQKNRTLKNKSTKSFLITDQVRDSLYFNLLKS